jgi:hypothetical protein
VWSQIELNALFERVGGTVTTRQVERSTHDGCSTWTATEITLTVNVPDVGPVEVVTDIEDDPEHGYRTDIPVVQAIVRYEVASCPWPTAWPTRPAATSVTPEVQHAVTRYEVAAARYRELMGLSREMTGAEFDALALAQDMMAASRATLAAAGQLHLIEVSQ